MLFLLIDRESVLPLTRQIYEQIRDKILKQELRAGTRLPPTRKLAEDLGVARNVVTEAYEQLSAEGFLEARQGSGTYVARESYLERYTEYRELVTDLLPPPDKDRETDFVSFDSGTPDLSRFPRKLWASYLKEACVLSPDQSLSYGAPAGSMKLRRRLAEFLLRNKGILCSPRQLFILAGSAQAFIILTKLLELAPEGIIVEDPLYRGIQDIFRSLGVSLWPVPVDDKGIQVDRIPALKKDIPILITPSHQFPFGCVLPIQRRVRLIELVRKTASFVIENDYDSEFRYVGAPISSLHLLDPERVIHIGTFSESMYPGLRLGYLVLPDALVEGCIRVVGQLSLSATAVSQTALASFIEDGQLERHMSRMKKLYRRKRETLIAALRRAFGQSVRISGDSTGLYLVACFRGIEFGDEMLRRLEAHHVSIERVADHAIVKGGHEDKIILGYGNLEIEAIEEGIRRLQQAVLRP
jgi:GntR family transcriptional regulator/MocR family aminotransferase